MSTPYSGASASGASASGASQAGQPAAPPPGYTDPTQPTYPVGPDDPQGQSYNGDMGAATTGTGRPDVQNTSVGQLIGEATKDLSTLMRQELELAKAEMKVEAKKAGQGAGLFGAAGVARDMLLLFLSIALWWALSHLVGHSWSALIVAVLWGIVGAVAFVIGRKKFQQVNPKPEQTIDTLQQVPSALKPN